MSMIKCPECQSDVSDKADACPKCGFSFAKVRKKKQQSKNAIGCVAIMVLFIIVFLAIPDGKDEKKQPVTSNPVKKELTAEGKYAKRIDRCISPVGLRYALQVQLTRNLISPKSYEADDIRCNYPKEKGVFLDTLHCIHRFTSKNKFGVELPGTAYLKIILPPYNTDMYQEKCYMEILQIVNE